MWWTKCIRKLLTSNLQVETKKNPKTIKDLDIFDDVWVRDDGVVYKGWVFDISRRCITILYNHGQFDYKFRLPRPLVVEFIEQGDKVLYCNEPVEL